MIKNVNTIEEYRSLDKGAILSKAAQTVGRLLYFKSKVRSLTNWVDLGCDQ